VKRRQTSWSDAPTRQQIRFESAFVTQVTGPANIRVCGYNWLGDPWTPLSQPYSISRRAGPLNASLSPARSPRKARLDLDFSRLMPHGEAPLAHIERAAVLCRPVLSFNTDTDTHAQPGFKACANGTLSFTFLSLSLPWLARIALDQRTKRFLPAKAISVGPVESYTCREVARYCSETKSIAGHGLACCGANRIVIVIGCTGSTCT